MRIGRFLLGLGLLALLAPRAMAQSEEATKRILIVPPLQWDSGAASFRPAFRQTASDFANLTGGIVFGLKPPEVNVLLAEPQPRLDWNSLPLAPEFPEDVRFFWHKIGKNGALNAGINSCVGETSYLVFLFRSRGLFRISYRLIPDRACPSVADAATAVMAHFTTIDPTLALAMHYRNGNAQVVDIVDPGSGHLRTIRWQQRRR
jgi:hypothetical protein